MLFLGILLACNNKSIQSDIEVISALSDNKSKAHNLFEKVSVLSLETSDLCLIAYIDRIEIWDGKIFILNSLQSHNNILCFDMQGNFLFSIDRMGNGPEEYTYLGDFLIDKRKGELVLMNENGVSSYFDMQGNFLYKKHTYDQYFNRQTIYLNDSSYLAFNDGDIEPKNHSLLYLNSETMDIRNKSNKINEFYFNAISKRMNMYNRRILCLTYSDSIYDITDTSNVKIPYYIDFNKTHSSVKEVIRQNISEWSWDEQIDYENKYYYEGKSFHISGICENKKYIALKCMKATSKNRRGGSIYYNLFYDKLTKKTYNSENIDFGGISLINLGILSSDNECFYCGLYSELSEDDKSKIKNNPIFSDEDKKKLIEYTEYDNPLLIILE